MAILKQSTGYARKFLMVLASDHISPATGKTVVVKISQGTSGAFGTAAGVVTEIANGWYQIVLTGADTSVYGDLAYNCTVAGGLVDPTDFVDQVRTFITDDIGIDASGNVSIASNIKKNQVLNGFTFVMTDNINHQAATGLTVSAQRSLSGAGFAPCANAVTELSNGVYSINLAATDTNGNTIMLRFTAAGADDLDISLLTQP